MSAEVVQWPDLEPAFRKLVVTPVIAAAMLASNTHNRKMGAAVVERYATMMKAGQWRCTMADPITFDNQGVLQDGQHRLQAVVRSQVSVEFWVASGADPEDFHVIGTGRRRSVADVLSIAGYTNVNVRAAAARSVLSYERIPGKVWAVASSGITDIDVSEEAVKPEYDAVIPYLHAVRRHTHLITPSAVVTHSVLVLKYSERPNDLDDFVEHLASGAGLDYGNPILTLRNWYMGDNSRIKSGSWTAQRRIAIHTRAWNAWVTGEQLKQLKFNQQNLPMPGVK
jgi:hypothetical protein